ncbi:MAG: ABC transporter permease [Chloroflexi bacterium]|nr:ABC transporter permease [Chloroflexota bacterium]
MAKFDHKDLFGKTGPGDMLDYLQSHLQARDLSRDEALAILGAVHVELTNPKDSNRGVYQKYSQFMEALHSEMPDVHDFVVSAWGERSGVRADLAGARKVEKEGGKIAGGLGIPPFFQFIIRRLFFAFVSLVVITMLLFGGVMLTPPLARAQLYLPPGRGGERATQNLLNTYISKYHLADPYLVQYMYWVSSLFTDSWGYSPTLREYVLPSLLHRTPATLELALYSLLLLIPLGLASGLMAGWRNRGWFDRVFRFLAFLGTSMPPFILALMLIAIFYVKLGWFAPGRLGILIGLDVAKATFHNYTGFLTVDSLLNGRFDIFVDALRHLAMPVLTLSIFHWATLGRITRATVIGERRKDYIVAAKARGVGEASLMWRHALRAILAPSLTTMLLTAASIVTGVFVAEIIYNINGVSQVIVIAMNNVPDMTAALGFSVYSIIMVIGLMFILDVLQALFDPRIRDEVSKA